MDEAIDGAGVSYDFRTDYLHEEYRLRGFALRGQSF